MASFRMTKSCSLWSAMHSPSRHRCVVVSRLPQSGYDRKEWLPGRDERRFLRSGQCGAGDRRIPMSQAPAGECGHTGQHHATALQPVPQTEAPTFRRGPRRRLRTIRQPDRRGTPPERTTGLPLVSRCGRSPRRYRGKDVMWWVNQMGDTTARSIHFPPLRPSSLATRTSPAKTEGTKSTSGNWQARALCSWAVYKRFRGVTRSWLPIWRKTWPGQMPKRAAHAGD